MKNLLFLAACIILVILLYSLSQEKVSPFPADDDHINISQETDCLQCHGEDGGQPRKKDHPPKDQCFKCHERKAEYSFLPSLTGIT